MNDKNIHAEDTLDATGLICPMPVLKAKKRLQALPEGGILKVMATDRSAVKDFENFCQTTRATLLQSSEEEGMFIFLIRK